MRGSIKTSTCASLFTNDNATIYTNVCASVYTNIITEINGYGVRDAMLVLTELLESEDNAIVRAVLGHFFFVYIHPYMDGNGRTARFLMNVMPHQNGGAFFFIGVWFSSERYVIVSK